MAFPPKTSVESIDDADTSKDSKGGPKGPPPQSPKPKSQSPFAGSLFGQAGAAQTGEQSSGLGSEGSDPGIIGTQGYALIQRGIQMLNLAFPNDPGLAAVLTDVMGRLQLIIPQLVAGQNQPAGGGMGLFPPGGQPPPPGGAPPSAPPMAGGPQGPVAPPMPQPGM